MAFDLNKILQKGLLELKRTHLYTDSNNFHHENEQILNYKKIISSFKVKLNFYKTICAWHLPFLGFRVCSVLTVWIGRNYKFINPCILELLVTFIWKNLIFFFVLCVSDTLKFCKWTSFRNTRYISFFFSSKLYLLCIWLTTQLFNLLMR